MRNEPLQEFTDLETLADIPLSELVEPQWLDLPQIQPQDLELPYDYIQDLMQRGVVSEDMPEIDIDTRLLDGPEQEQPFFQEQDDDFGR
jgi:hypothetical protein